MTRLTSAGRRAALGALIGVLTAACVSIPSESSVRAGQPVGVQDDPELISNLPENVPPGPVPGATREEVASGFFAAMLAYPQTAARARQFLTPSAAASWDPGKGLVVYEDQVISERRGGVSVKTEVLGSLDARGSWSSAKPATSKVRARMHLERVSGEWRITDPAAGTFVDRDYFDLYFGEFSLYFFDPTLLVLTPDPVYLLLGDTTATSLVSDLFLGPTRDLAGVARTAVPPDTEVDVAVSTADNGTVEVPLSATVEDLSAEARLLFAAQLTWTLRQLPEVEAISLTVDGSRLDVPGVSVNGVFDVDEFEGYDPAFASKLALFALSPTGLVTVTEDDATVVPGPVAAAAKRARYAAVDPKTSLAAVVERDGRVLVGGISASAEAPAKWFRGSTSLLPPSWDVHKVLWLVDRDPKVGATVFAVTAEGRRQVPAPGIGGKRVKSFAVSRDGVRLAAVVKEAGSSRLVISVIDRDSRDPTDVSLSKARPVISPSLTASRLTGLAWVSPTAVMVLASEQGGERQPFAVSFDGSRASAVGGFLPIEPVSVAAGPNVDAPVVIGGENGAIYVQTPELQWDRFGGSTPLRAPVYPG